jgi:hypothetical protein
VYAVPEEVHEWIKQEISVRKTGHNYSLGIRSIKDADVSGYISLDILTSQLYVVVSSENKLLLAQSFSYSTPADVVYYLLKVCQQFNFSQRQVKLFLSGLIEKNSALYKELHQYFCMWHSEKPHGVTINTRHIFVTSLNDLARCAS